MKPGMEIHTCNPNTWEAKAERSMPQKPSLSLIKAWGCWLVLSHPLSLNWPEDIRNKGLM